VVVNQVESASDIEYVRKILGEKGKGVQVHAKIKSLKGLQKIEEILDAADGITLQRSQLAMEISFNSIAYAIPHIMKRCHVEGKFIGIPTRVKETGLKGAVPMLTEVNDIMCSVDDGIDCFILSIETAVGDFYVESIMSIKYVIEEAERHIDFISRYYAQQKNLVESQPIRA
jgi:pyruvate kinase